MKILSRNILIVAFLFFIVGLAPVFAQVNGTVPGGGGTGVGPGGGGTGVSIVNPAGGFNIPNPLNVSTVCGLIKKILAFVLAIGMPIAALFLVWAGFLFVKARGNASELGVAKKNLVAVILGIAIFAGAWLLGQVIANTLISLSPSNVSSVSSCS